MAPHNGDASEEDDGIALPSSILAALAARSYLKPRLSMLFAHPWKVNRAMLAANKWERTNFPLPEAFNFIFNNQIVFTEIYPIIKLVSSRTG